MLFNTYGAKMKLFSITTLILLNAIAIPALAAPKPASLKERRGLKGMGSPVRVPESTMDLAATRDPAAMSENPLGAASEFNPSTATAEEIVAYVRSTVEIIKMQDALTVDYARKLSAIALNIQSIELLEAIADKDVTAIDFFSIPIANLKKLNPDFIIALLSIMREDDRINCETDKHGALLPHTLRAYLSNRLEYADFLIENFNDKDRDAFALYAQSDDAIIFFIERVNGMRSTDPSPWSEYTAETVVREPGGFAGSNASPFLLSPSPFSGNPDEELGGLIKVLDILAALDSGEGIS